MRRWIGILTAALSTAALVWAMTVNGSLEVLGTLRANVVDFTAAATTAPMKVGSALPGACSLGQAFFKLDAAAGQNIYLCTSPNTWTQAAGGGTADGRPDPQYLRLLTEFSDTYALGTPAYLGDFVFYRAAGSSTLNLSSTGRDRVGVTRIQTSATANDRQQWYAQFANPGSAAESLYARTDRPWELQCIFRYPGASDYQNSEWYMGIHSQFSGEPPRGFGVRYRSAVDTAFVFYADEAGGTWGSTLASNVAPDTAWHKLKIRSDGTQSYRMWISLDGGTEYSICPSGCNITLPSGSASLFMKTFAVSIKTTEAAQKSIELDYLYFWMNWGAR